jgi:glycosyltransferase involved in cell wall biosynthesis
LFSSYRNFELIHVDVASTDKTLSIARNYEQKDSKVRVYIDAMPQQELQNIFSELKLRK